MRANTFVPPDVSDPPFKLPKRSKYGAVRTTVEWAGEKHSFHSKKEADRFLQLKLLERAGDITHVEKQPRFKCEVNGQHITEYRADFRYFDKVRGARVVEDVKGHRTREYIIKKALTEALFNVRIEEV